MSKFTEKTLTELETNKVLRDFATALKNKGFFDDPNWSNALLEVFKDVEKTIIDENDAHEISSSFAEDPSKFNKKNKKPLDNVNVNPIFDMFDDSNDSFEIPETQADPPRDDQADDTDDELNSEAFVAIPDEEMPSNDILQSQDLLGGVSLLDSQVNETHESDGDKTTSSKGIEDVELKKNCTFNDFDDSDAIDLEMSKLEWDDTGKEEDNSKSASVTPDLDFDFLSSTKVAGNDNKSASVTPDLNFDLTASSATANHLLPQSSNSDLESKNTDISSDVDQKEIETGDQNKPKGDEADATQVFTKPTKPVSKTKKNPVPDVETEATQLFVKPTSASELNKIHKSGGNTTTERELLNQLFTKPASSYIEQLKIDNGDEMNNVVDDVEETQLFVKSDLNGEEDGITVDVASNMVAVQKSNNRLFSFSDEEDANENAVTTNTNIAHSNAEISHTDDDDEYAVVTQKFEVKRSIKHIIISLDEEESDDSIVKTEYTLSKPNGPNAEIPNEEDNEYSAATQIFEVKKSSKSNKHVTVNTLEKEDGDAIVQNDKRLGKTNGDEIEADNQADISTPKIKEHKSKSNNRNRIISSSDEENDNDDRQTPFKVESPLPTESGAEENNEAAEMSVKTENHVNIEEGSASVSKTLESKKYGFVKDLKGADWPRLCDDSNSKQSKITFVNVFEQSKELRIRAQNELCPGNLVVTKDVDVKNVNGSEEIQTSTSTSTLGNVRKSSRNKKKIENSESSATSDAELKASKPKKRRHITPEPSSSKSSTTVPKPDDVKGNVEMQATQVFHKASTSQIKPPKVLPRRQAKSASLTATEKTPTKNAAKEPIRRLRENYNQSVTYSPGPSSLVKSVSVENENNNTKSIKVDQSTNDASTRTRKRKAVTEVCPVVEKKSDNSMNSSSETSDSVNRTSRNHHFRVMFTMIDPEPYKPILKQLHITIATDDHYNALITDRVYRTTKFMCALAAGKPIVSINWLEALQKGKSMLDPFKFLLNDKDGEEKYKFSLAKTLSKVAESGGIFRNHSVLVTPNTSPTPEIFKDLIVSSGGKYLKTSLVPRKDDIVLCVSDPKDEKMWKQLKNKYSNLKYIVNVEGFMQAIFQYNSDLQKYVIKN